MNLPQETVTDARGVQVPLRTYQSVVSLVPSLTDTVFGLGAGDRLVGRTIYCVEPRDRVREITAFGGTKNPDIEAIINLGPDLILACVEENKPEHLEQLEAAGIAVHAVMPRSLDDVANLLRDYGALLEAKEAAGKALSDLVSARLAAGTYRSRLETAPRSVTLIWKKPWMATGTGNHIDAVMKELGLNNVLDGREGYFEVETEELVALDLDLILLPDEPFPFTHHVKWSLAAAGAVAGRDQAMILDGKLMCWYGTRTARSLRTLVKLM